MSMDWMKKLLCKPPVRIVACTVCVAVCVSMLATVAWAWYSAAVSSGSNILQLGTWTTLETTEETEESIALVDDNTEPADETTAPVEETTEATEETTEAVEETTVATEETTEAVEETTVATEETTEAMTEADQEP